MNENLAWSDWRCWLNWFLFGTFGYGGGLMGWYLCLFMWLLLHVPLAMVTMMVIGGTIAGTGAEPISWEVIQLNAPRPNLTTWTAVTITTMITSCTILLGSMMKQSGIGRGFCGNETSRVGKVGVDWHGNGRYPPHSQLTLRRSFMV